jgi:hypothetical protein
MGIWRKDLAATASTTTTCPTATHATTHRGWYRLSVRSGADRGKDRKHAVPIAPTSRAAGRIGTFGHSAQHLKFFLARFTEILVQRHDALPNLLVTLILYDGVFSGQLYF